MKKASLVFCLLFAFVLTKAQQSFLFKIKSLPDHLYETNMGMSMNMEMNMSGDSATMQQIQAKGIKLPMLITSVTNMDMSIKTGLVAADNSFPIVMNYNSIVSKKTLNGTETSDPPNPLLGQKMFGQYTPDGKLKIDSISGKTLDEQTKATITTAVGKMVNQIHFPDHPLKIGDTFTQEVPFDMPMAGSNMQLTIKIIYKLTAVDKKSAFFDLEESMDMNSSSTEMTMKGAGTGSGTLVYDINNNWATTLNSNLKMNYQMQAGKFAITGDATISSTHQTKISAGAK
jgi:hypothetical protein